MLCGIVELKCLPKLVMEKSVLNSNKCHFQCPFGDSSKQDV